MLLLAVVERLGLGLECPIIWLWVPVVQSLYPLVRGHFSIGRGTVSKGYKSPFCTVSLTGQGSSALTWAYAGSQQMPVLEDWEPVRGPGQSGHPRTRGFVSTGHYIV